MTPELMNTLLYAVFALAGFFLKKWMGPDAPTVPTQPVVPAQTYMALPPPLVPPTLIGAMVDEVTLRQAQLQREAMQARVAEFLQKG